MDLCSQAHNCCPLYPVCFLRGSCGFFFLIRRSLPVFVFFSLLLFTSLNVLQQLSAPRPHSAGFVSCCFFFSSFFDVHFADVSDCFLRGDGCCFLATQILGLIVAMTLNSIVCCFYCVLADFHPTLFYPSLPFDWDLSCVQLSCVQYTTPFLLLPSSS